LKVVGVFVRFVRRFIGDGESEDAAGGGM
jgi:hypothetical protein